MCNLNKGKSTHNWIYFRSWCIVFIFVSINLQFSYIKKIGYYHNMCASKTRLTRFDSDPKTKEKKNLIWQWFCSIIIYTTVLDFDINMQQPIWLYDDINKPYIPCIINQIPQKEDTTNKIMITSLIIICP